MAAAFATAQPMRRLLVFISLAKVASCVLITHLRSSPFYCHGRGGGPHEFGRFVPLDELMELNFLVSSGANRSGR